MYFRGRKFGISILDRYIFREILIPFTVALLFWTTLFMSVVLKDVVGELLGKGVNTLKVLQYISYLIGEKLTETIPMASLFAGIMAAGRLSGDSEITAMRSAGISFPRMYSIFLLSGVLAGSLVAFMNLYYGPISSRAREDFEDWLKAYHSLTLVRPGRFLGAAKMDGITQKGQDIYAENKLGATLYRIQIREWLNALDNTNSEVVSVKNVSIPIGDGFITQVIHAEEGELLSRVNPDGEEEKFLRLKDGFIIEVNEDRSEYNVTNFKKGFMDYVIPPPIKPMGRLNVRPDNYTFFELFDFLEKLQKGGHKIDLCAISPECKGGGGSQKVGEVNEENGTVFTLPAFSEMEKQVKELQIWLMRKGSKAGKPGGPTKEESQQKFQLFVQFNAFLGDAEKTRTRFRVEIHKRLATPVATVLFFFISFPLGLVVKRSGKGMGFALALMIFFIYYLFLTMGLNQAYSEKLSPWLGAWLPDIVIGAVGIYVMAVRTDGFTPWQIFQRAVRSLYTRWIEPFLSRIPVPEPIRRFFLRPIFLRIFGYFAFVVRIPGYLVRFPLHVAFPFLMERIIPWFLERFRKKN